MIPNRALEEALARPPGEYVERPLYQKMGVIVGMQEAATCAENKRQPVIGTRGVHVCTALILYNKATKNARLLHKSGLDGDDFLALLSKVRNNDNDPIEAHIV